MDADSKVERAIDSVRDSIDRVASAMTPALRNHALESGWPPDVVSRLSVVNSDGMLVADIAEDRKRLAEELEYGGPGSVPKPALWTFFMNKKRERTIRRETDLASDSIVSAFGEMMFR